MELFVTLMSGETHPLYMESQMTVGDLKGRISETFNMPVTGQRLSCENGQILNNDSEVLSVSGLHPGSRVSVILTPEPATLQVFLKNEKGKTSTYDITPGETVSQFKRKVQNKDGVPVDQQRLIHQGIQMDDGKTLQDYGVGANSTIHQTLRLRGGLQISWN